MTSTTLALTRAQILAFRRQVGALDERRPPGRASLRLAAWAGLQDSMPRAALLSIHARVEGTTPSTWEDPSLVQLWGPRYSTYVVPKRDFALFSLGRLPETGKARERAERMAERMHAHLGGVRMTDRELGRARRFLKPSQTLAVSTNCVICFCVVLPLRLKERQQVLRIKRFLHAPENVAGLEIFGQHEQEFPA